MEAQKPKIALYVQRSFGEKLTATFDFIKENWKPLMKFTTISDVAVFVCFQGTES